MNNIGSTLRWMLEVAMDFGEVTDVNTYSTSINVTAVNDLGDKVIIRVEEGERND